MEEMENNSGKGKGYPIPEGIEGWAWGPCLLNFIWSIGNRTWIGLLSLVPYAGTIMAIILGFKGRAWAWQNKRWESVEHFNRVQHKWTIWGIIITLGLFLLAIIVPLLLGPN